jgi:PTS system mannose-specific IIA component
MIKILIVSHCGLTEELIKTAETIAGKQENLFSINKTIDDDNLCSLQERITKILEEINDEKGTLILTDMLGGTPCNASVPMCQKFNIEVLTGVNLPMLLSALFTAEPHQMSENLPIKFWQTAEKA